MEPDLSASVIPPAELDPLDREAWRRMRAASEHLRSAFFSFEYVHAIAAVRPLVYVCAIRRGGRPQAFLPFQFPSRLHRVLRAAERVGGEMTDYFGLIAESGFTIDHRALLRLAGLNHLVFTHLHESQTAYGLAGARPETGLLIDIGDSGRTYWEWLRRRDRKFVQDTERRQRNLEADYGELRFEAAECEWREPLHALIDFKRRQYKTTHAIDALADKWKRDLLESLAANQSTQCRGVLSTLHAGHTWVASQFSLQSGDCLHNWFPVYDSALARYAPGRLLLKLLIEQAGILGIRLIDRGVGDTQAKRDFANAAHLFYRGAWSCSGVRAAAYRLAYSLQWRLSQTRRAYCKQS